IVAVDAIWVLGASGVWTATVNDTTPDAPAARVPIGHVTVVPVRVPPVDALTKSAEGESVATSVTPVAAFEPVLPYEKVKVTCPPGATVLATAAPAIWNFVPPVTARPTGATPTVTVGATTLSWGSMTVTWFVPVLAT